MPRVGKPRSFASRLLSGVAVALVMAASGWGATRVDQGGGTLVWGTAADAISLDAALNPDQGSVRIADQLLEGLVELAPGRTSVVPGLAARWSVSKNGLVWTFFLRKGVKFHDGTPLDAAAVCFNFERWYGFTGSLQRATYYWGQLVVWGQLVFGGFRRPEKGSAGPNRSLYRSCQRGDATTVRLRLARKSSSFLAVLAYPSLGIASPTALRRYDADKGHVDSNGTFHPAGTYGTAHPSGTGPFMFKSWRPNRELVLVRNPNYWGKKAKLDRLVFRPIPDRAARLRALQRGAIHGYDDEAVGAVDTIRRQPALKVLDRPSAMTGYVGINQAIPPMNKLLVRQAVAYGLNRASVVRSFYDGQAEVADQLLPPAYVGHSTVKQYPYDPERSKALLRRAGLTLPVKVDFWFPTEGSRPYMLDPKRNFDAFVLSLGRAGFKVVPHSAPWNPPDYAETIAGGKAQLYLLGWIADGPDPNDFFGYHFQRYLPQFGFRNPQLFGLVDRAAAETNVARRARLYQSASRKLMELLPIVPYSSFHFAVALRKNVTGYVPAPTGPINESFVNVAFSSR